MNLEDDLFDLCLGERNPSTTLLNEGAFPGGWVDRYFQLLEQANEQWGNEETAPRKAVAAIHFASTYLHVRFGSWRRMNHKDNQVTDNFLAHIRTRGELWLLGPIVQKVTEHPRRQDL